MKKKAFLIAIFIGLATLLSGLYLQRSQNVSEIPDVNLKTIDGHEIGLRQMQGKTVLVTFWASTCAICMEELPFLISLYSNLNSKGLEIIAINMAYDPPNRILDTVQENKIPYPVALDIDSSANRAFGNIEITPTTFLITPDGKIDEKIIGAIDHRKLEKKIQDLLTSG